MNERRENTVQNQQWQLTLGERAALRTPAGEVIPLGEDMENKLRRIVEREKRLWDSEPQAIRELRASGFKFGRLREGGWGPGDQNPI